MSKTPSFYKSPSNVVPNLDEPLKPRENFRITWTETMTVTKEMEIEVEISEDLIGKQLQHYALNGNQLIAMTIPDEWSDQSHQHELISAISEYKDKISKPRVSKVLERKVVRIPS